MVQAVEPDEGVSPRKARKESYRCGRARVHDAKAAGTRARGPTGPRNGLGADRLVGPGGYASDPQDRPRRQVKEHNRWH